MSEVDAEDFNVGVERLRENHKSVVETKRRTDARLRAAIAGLQQIYDVAGDNDTDTCNHRMALKFVREVAGAAFEKATDVTNKRRLRSAHEGEQERHDDAKRG